MNLVTLNLYRHVPTIHELFSEHMGEHLGNHLPKYFLRGYPHFPFGTSGRDVEYWPPGPPVPPAGAVSKAKGAPPAEPRPGSPLADCVFHILMMDIIIELNEWIHNQDSYMEVLREFDIQIDTIVWSDDLAIPWCTRQAADFIYAH